MKKHVYLGNRKSTCVTEMISDKENIHRSIKSIRSFSKSVRKLRDRNNNHNDWQTLQTLATPTSKSNRYSFLPRIGQFKKAAETKRKVLNKNCAQVINFMKQTPYKFSKSLQKRNKKYQTLDLSIDIELDRLKGLTQNCSKLLHDLSEIQQNKIISNIRYAIQSSTQKRIIEL